MNYRSAEGVGRQGHDTLKQCTTFIAVCSLGVSDLDKPRPDASLGLPKESCELVLSDMTGNIGNLKRSP